MTDHKTLDTTLLEWVEPHPALNAFMELCDATVTLRASREDCINIARYNLTPSQLETNPSDDDLLVHFIANHWTSPVPPDWRPISTAPKDGTVIIVWPPTKPGQTSCARYNNGHMSEIPRPYWQRLDTRFPLESLRLPPTHWRPVLPGPTEAP